MNTEQEAIRPSTSTILNGTSPSTLIPMATSILGQTTECGERPETQTPAEFALALIPTETGTPAGDAQAHRPTHAARLSTEEVSSAKLRQRYHQFI